MDGVETLPPREFIYEDASPCSPAYECVACSAVMPSLPLTIKWLRDCVKENPSIRVQEEFEPFADTNGDSHFYGSELSVRNQTLSSVDALTGVLDID
ncbi:hypothetical protein JRO89_XS11G0071800 [Xanthoceras sorbifolium]|uniref:Uncharacterized protein n=1 Tax=Xanthoceras sorbifolium TaxID=99658 RepID=A0ABQ8HEZ3_9ROSI|nr:hypothetical protein JRO89_XS11G0071800 [Xanthoceras sorbifolium]